MTVRIKFENRNVGIQFRQNVDAAGRRVSKSLISASAKARREILSQGRANIRSAGRFGKRWTEGLRASFDEAQVVTQEPRDITLVVRHMVPYFMIHQKGGIIRGRPLLWIPLSHTGIKIRAREYGRRYGLFRVDRKGGKAPLLLSMRDKKPKYFGKEQVRIRKKFRVIEIIREVSRKIPAYYRDAFAKSRD